MEIYKDIQGYENLYQISNMGNVKSLNKRKGRILKPAKIKNGYLRVDLCKQGKQKQYYIHRLVAEAFIENSDNLPQVNHKDEDKKNNAASNLEWCDHKYNINYGSHNKRVVESNINHPNKSKQVLCVETGVVYASVMQVGRELGFLKGGISKCCNGKRNTCGGFHWCYV